MSFVNTNKQFGTLSLTYLELRQRKLSIDKLQDSELYMHNHLKMETTRSVKVNKHFVRPMDIGHPKTQTMQTADCRLQTVQTVQTVQTEYFFLTLGSLFSVQQFQNT